MILFKYSLILFGRNRFVFDIASVMSHYEVTALLKDQVICLSLLGSNLQNSTYSAVC